MADDIHAGLMRPEKPEMYFFRRFLLIGIVLLSGGGAISQFQNLNLKRLLNIPRHYTVLSITEKINIDGLATDAAWQRAPWTEDFVDIESGASRGNNHKRTRCKMVWDSTFLYVLAELQEEDVWANINAQDAPVFQNNALEIFINPDGSTFNYFEFQINAIGAVWDLYMPRPYRSGGRGLSSWDIKGLKKAVHIAGTLNQPGDKDTSWTVELAIPFSSLGVWRNATKSGTIWRMNFSRVHWQHDAINGTYSKKRDPSSGRFLPERYTVWSPQGILNLHFPERWGYVLFADSVTSSGFLSETMENLKLNLWKYYYLQQIYKTRNKKYAVDISLLNALLVETPKVTEKGIEIKMSATEKQFLIMGRLDSSDDWLTLDHEGEMRKETVLR